MENLIERGVVPVDTDIKISLVASSVRPRLWGLFYESLLKNMISFEVIFVGPKTDHLVPGPRFRYIETNVKPAQCYEIGFRAARGELVTWTADDAEYSSHALDNAYKYYKQFNSDKTIIAFRAIEDGKEMTEVHHLIGYDTSTPLMAPFGLMDRNLYYALGGYDRRFICGQSENDIVMRVYEIGGRVEVCPNATVFVDHKRKHCGRSTFRTKYSHPENGQLLSGFYKQDRDTLESSWISDGSVCRCRLNKVERFDDFNILTQTQGERGVW